MRFPRVALAMLTALVAGCADNSAPAVDLAAEERAIRAADDGWNAAIATKNVDGVTTFYASDGVAMWPDSPPRQGADIRAGWAEMIGSGATVKIVPEKIQIAQAGDIALDQGHVDIEMDTPQGHVKDVVKYLVVWKKENGQWKALYDMYNSNAPTK